MEINTIAKSCPDLYDIRTVAEIGAGYGRLACLFVKFLPHVQYHIFDIPPALAIAQNYLLQCLGPSYVSFFKDDDSPQPQLVEDNRQPRVKCFLPHQLEHFPEKYFDLVINISSIDEMRGDQIQHYFRMMDRLARKYIYLKGFSKVDMGNGVIADVRSYPYGKAWSQVYFGQDKVIPTFVEQVFHVES
jgi:putative sugar O-methyltransferase